MTDPRNELFLGWLRERDAQVSRMLEPWIEAGFDCVRYLHQVPGKVLPPNTHAGARRGGADSPLSILRRME